MCDPIRDLDEAISHYGGEATRRLDLSTSINRVPYPVSLSPDPGSDLRTDLVMQDLITAARNVYATEAPILPLVDGAEPMELILSLLPAGELRILAPSCGALATRAKAAGWQVTEVARMDDLAGAALAVVANPNLSGGSQVPSAVLQDLARQVGFLIVDESDVDAVPDRSLAPRLDDFDNVIVLRSLANFYGLAGVGLAFALGPARVLMAMRKAIHSSTMSAPALAMATQALGDGNWVAETRARLQTDATRLDRLASDAGWQPVGGTPLFRLFDTGKAASAQKHLTQARVWSRTIPVSPSMIGLGLPGATREWEQVEAAMRR